MLSNQIQSNKNKGQNRNPKNHKKTLQVKSITKDNVLINQESFSYEKHYSNKKFMLVSKEIGYFNKITKFVCSDDKSLLFFDSFGEQLHLSISEAKERNDLFLMYPNAFPTNNEKVLLTKNGTYFGKEVNETEELKLNFKLGYELGEHILLIKNYTNTAKFD